jgi:predicted secreted protein
MRRTTVPLLALLLMGAAACSDDDGGDGDREYGGEPVETTAPAGHDEPFGDGAAILTLQQTDVQVTVGDDVVVQLDQNQSVGDNWEIQDQPDDVILRFVEETNAVDDPEADGGGGTVQFIFQAVGDGHAELTVHNCFRCDTDGNSTEEPPEPAEVEFSVEVTA